MKSCKSFGLYNLHDPAFPGHQTKGVQIVNTVYLYG